MIETLHLSKAYRLINHGPTVLVSSAHEGRRNVMAAAWNMPLDFDPPKVAIVVDKNTWTRELIEASGCFAISVPCRAQAQLVIAAGSDSGREHDANDTDKFEALGIRTLPASVIEAPLIDGCVAWLECRLIPEPHVAQAYDLLLAEVVAAHADSRAFSRGRWHFEGHDDLRTLHHTAGGAFLAIGEALRD